MCGICGIYNFDSSEVVQDTLVRSMSDTLVHRGPDDEGLFVDRNVGLGHRRLSIIDLDTGHQPLFNEDGSVVIVFNGEIYNFRSLRRDLETRGHRFNTRTDTECIIHGYEQWGIQIVHRLRGMFALAIWDRRANALFIARDRLGKKPLYYFLDKHRLIFASEIKAILEDATVPRRVNIEALSDYLSLLYIPAPKTIYQDIFKLPPGHWLLARRDNVQVREYWDVPFRDATCLEETDATVDLYEQLRDAVTCRLISDVPLGAFLSGGIDSSSIVYLMHEINNNGLNTASIGFEDGGYDELSYCRMLGNRFDTKYHEYVVKPDAKALLPKIAWYLDEPHADSSAIPTFYVSKMARQTVTVALSGDGGDENFAGYARRYYFDLPQGRLVAAALAGQEYVL
jgi:asparagine synthase (glutamine-hydrolysing)